jgi:small subunit ribosomal protein S11
MTENKKSEEKSVKKEEKKKELKKSPSSEVKATPKTKKPNASKKIEEKKTDKVDDIAKENKEAVEEFKSEEVLIKPVKAASKDTSGKFVQKKKKRKVRRQIQRGQAYVKATYNNTLVTLSDLHGNVLAWSSSGYLGFKGAKKATTYAASQVVMDVAEKVQKYGLKDLDVYVKGVGSGRESAIRTLAQKGFNLNLIKDRTPIPHNGCRPKKPRRV